LNKIFELGQYFANTFEPSVQIIDEKDPNEKIASEALDYIKKVKPKEGKTTVLVIAMGADENWGANRNGDGFPEEDLKKNFKNFETKYNKENKIDGGALVFKHHKNKLVKGHPWYGTVKKAFYNDRMHRVELLLDVDNKKAPDIVERIKQGEYPAVSMGVKIPYDTCSICGKDSPKVAEYCDHLKYSMNDILPDGRKVYAINGNYDYEKHASPLNFFDISFVFRPADQTGYMIKKVANYVPEEKLEGSAVIAEKMAQEAKISEDLKKLSKIYKHLRGDVGAAKNDEGELALIDKFKDNGLDTITNNVDLMPADTVDKLTKYPLNEVLSTLSKNNILLTTPEFIQLVMKKMTGKDVPLEFLYMATKLQAEAFDELAKNPEIVNDLAKLPMFEEKEASSEIEEIIKDIKDNRDFSDSGLLKKADTSLLRSALDMGSVFPGSSKSKGMTHTENVVTPDGKVLVASQGAIDNAQFWEWLGKMGKDFGTSLGLLGVYSLLKSQGMLGKAIAPIALVTSAVAGGKGIAKLVSGKEGIGNITTTSGKLIPSTTPMIEKKSSDEEEPEKPGYMPSVSTVLLPIGITKLLSNYYENKAEDGTLGQNKNELSKMVENLGSIAFHHPILFGGAIYSGLHAAQVGGETIDYLRKKKEQGIKLRKMY